MRIPSSPLLIIACMSLTCIADEPVERIRKDLIRERLYAEARSKNMADEPCLSPFVVAVEARTFQVDAAAGLFFVVEITNGGPQERTLLDPMDRISIVLVDSQGRNCNLPWQHPAWMSRRLSGAQMEAQAREAIDAKREFSIDRSPLSASRGVKTANDIVDEEITLGPGETLRFSVRITRVLADPAEYARKFSEWNPRTGDPPKPEAKSVPIPPGEYTLQVWLMLALKEPWVAHTLRSERIPVRLGPQTAGEE